MHPFRRLGRYEILVPVAKGGMGEVFAARLIGLHGVERVVAIKTLRIASAVNRRSLLAEARVTSRVHHPNVVATLDLDEVDKVPYIVMELIDGVALSKLLQRLHQRGELLSPTLVTWIAMQCARGLHAAHELTDGEGRPLGLVHRDVSPQNILLAVTGEVKVADFGIAKFLGREDSTIQGEFKGKIAYMSPEHAVSVKLDRRSDIFSLGVVLWESLTGKRLFAAENPARTLIRVREFDPPSPAKLRAGVSADLAAITLRCLAKDRERRYSTGLELAEALRSALRSGGVFVDASDLAALVQGLFAAELADLARRIALAIAEAPPSRAARTRRGQLVRAPKRARAALSVLAAAATMALLPEAGRPPRATNVAVVAPPGASGAAPEASSVTAAEATLGAPQGASAAKPSQSVPTSSDSASSCSSCSTR